MADQTKDAVLLAAQPIFDRDNQVKGVELLYRNDNQQDALDVGEEQATAELLFNLCSGVTEQVQHYQAPAFINVSARFLLSEAFLPIAPEHVVIELVERIVPTPEIIECVGRWHRQGFRFALDDFEFGADWASLLQYASIIKVDVSQIGFEQACRHREALKHLDVLWLAERIEDQATRNQYHEAGFDLFQGYFFARPTPVHGKKIDPTGLQLTRLMGELHRSEPNLPDLIEIISDDPQLAIKLLKIANSPFYRTSVKIDSLREMILRLGLNYLRRWVILLSLLDNCSVEHTRLVLVRARACELMAEQRYRAELEPSLAYLAGILSGVELLFGMDTRLFVDQLQIDDRIKAAVVDGRGKTGSLLTDVIDAERRLIQKRGLAHIDEALLEAYREASLEVKALLCEVRS